MITGDIKNQIDRIWDSFWSGGISNPLEVIEQITYLLFIRRLDDLHTLEENKANRLKKPMERRLAKSPPERPDPDDRTTHARLRTMRTLTVPLDDRSYPIHIGERLLG